MLDPRTPLIFDGHNDLLARIHLKHTSIEDVVGGSAKGHIDLPRALKGGFAGGFFALWVPSTQTGASANGSQESGNYTDVPLPGMVAWEDAIKVVISEVAIFQRLAAAGVLTPCTTVKQLKAALPGEPMAAILHLEGAEAIDPEFYTLELLHAAGLRSLGPVWSRPTLFGHGVPFRFPSTGDIGPGLTDLGKELVRQCNRLKIMLDVSHLNEKGFDDLAAISDAPIVATHSNAHAVSPHARNLTDRQLAVIAERDGLVGLNFATAFLRDDGRMIEDTPIEPMLRHLDHLIAKLGEDRVALGSDFDGAIVPKDIADIGGLPALREAMRSHGFGDDLMAKICNGNWMRVLARTWGEEEEL
ncbi:dipeptidase [Martelella endophytica]|uniref:Peptidase M19 n=1 Tax=Martelella endophytica TaxID=1486262 RepID=A0A0D5LS26_MAREN|nr:dipeptidase [Martelella endophytica]AJY46989.1 peptidase M19 [Martelella endophytica]